ncbi:MAG: biotin carboxylase N-terminal domain-containing protein [Bowdeniella nasicola]|nr:biotin carboxylase N-terminal domain-containing protein [Bowdeniella nasicola]
MRKVLIANRGEIAVRVAHTCAEVGIASVAIFADPDAEALHVRVADEAYSLEGQSVAETYLDADKILAIAKRCGADAIHPGYGFLAERREFAQAVIDAGLIWIGPAPQTIELLGDKVAAREIAQRVGAPLVKGSAGNVPDAKTARRVAAELGFPIAIKAAFGGGGRGMRVVHRLEDVEEAFDSAVRESEAAFGRGECYLEQFLEKPRHVEAQVIADTHGNVYTLGTRDCSLQRRNQKLVEEAPAPFLTADQRELIERSARDICRAAGYVGVGTVEYLLGANGKISFLEVNTRIQVEHTVTEAVTGVDMVLAQLQIAAGKPVPVDDDLQPVGHAFQFRINAEDAGRGFLPATGEIDVFDPPTGPGIRIDTGVHTDSVISGRYDSMLAKIIIWGISRKHAIRRARRALKELRIRGITTVLPFHRAILEEPAFISEDDFGVYTTWIEQEYASTLEADPQFRQAVPSQERVRMMIEIDGKNAKLGLPAAFMRALSAGGGSDPMAALAGSVPDTHVNPAELRSPMAGTVLHVHVAEGDQVDEGAVVVVIEAMKTESPITAHRGGRVNDLQVAPGDSVSLDDLICHIEADD